MVNWLNSLFTIPTQYQFITYLILGTLVIICVSLVYGFLVGMISSVFTRR